MKPKCTFLMHISVLIVKDSVHIMPKIIIILPVCFLKWVNRIKLTSAQIMCLSCTQKPDFPSFFHFMCLFFFLSLDLFFHYVLVHYLSRDWPGLKSSLTLLLFSFCLCHNDDSQTITKLSLDAAVVCV